MPYEFGTDVRKGCHTVVFSASWTTCVHGASVAEPYEVNGEMCRLDESYQHTIVTRIVNVVKFR